MFSEENKIHETPPRTKNTGPPRINKSNNKQAAMPMSSGEVISHDVTTVEKSQIKQMPKH